MESKCTLQKDMLSLRLHVKRDNPGLLSSWFCSWATRLRSANSLHLELAAESDHDVDGSEDDDVDDDDKCGTAARNKCVADGIMNWGILQSLLDGAETSVAALTITKGSLQMYPASSWSSTCLPSSLPLPSWSSTCLPSSLPLPSSLFSKLSSLCSLRLRGALSHADIATKFSSLSTISGCISYIPCLKSLDLSQNKGLGATELSALHPMWSHLPFLKALDLGGNALESECVDGLGQALQHLSSLTFLGLSGSSLFDNISKTPSAQIKRLQHLAFLDLSQSTISDERGMIELLRHLCSVTSLTRLDLSEVVGFMLQGPRLFSEAMEQLADLRHLDMHAMIWNQQSGNAVTSKLVPDLRPLQHLRYLNVSDCSLGQLDAQSLTESLPSQGELTESLPSQGELTESLPSQGELTESLPSQGELTESLPSQGELTESLPSQGELLHLHLSLNAFDGKIPAAFMSALSCLVSLQHLNVSWVFQLGINDGRITDEDLGSLGRSLVCMTSLRHLEIGGNSLEDGMAMLAPALGQIAALTFLGLGDNELHMRDIASLVPSLMRLTSLKSLFVGKNKIGVGGASFMVPALRSLKNLTELDVSYNQLGPQGASSLSVAIASLTSLERLEIRGNHLGESGPSILAPALKGLSCLTHLDILHISVSRLDKRNELLEAVMHLPAFKLDAQSQIRRE
ncbi:hypothetical protein CEUSTIGMA_g13404.t1 [Chlamydomonas eustigma]|uniref:Uncharacterized protein n=1 Tax=Chlamydomonas eustigma TaxID=1157962 RepID=A0A250XSF0_9CHLO|nr:hypothetical protein CEUSTIGMA_g13404.t1 [Chlamydomonas eustigma]|eukprot:GAX85988.1 hypothetical protein CEUSTIGMA_g13404.t1 [Chlamydomonas eustigma]